MKHNYNVSHLKFTDDEIHLMLDGLYHLSIIYIGEKNLEKTLEKVNKLIDKITKNFPEID